MCIPLENQIIFTNRKAGKIINVTLERGNNGTVMIKRCNEVIVNVPMYYGGAKLADVEKGVYKKFPDWALAGIVLV